MTSTSLPDTDQNEHVHTLYGLQMGPNLPEPIACFGPPHDVIPKVMVTPNLSHSPRRRRISPGFCQQHRPPAHPCADKPGVQPAGTPPPTAHKDRRPLHLPHFLSPAQPTPFLPCHFPICPSSLVIFLFFSFLSFIAFRSHLEEGFHQPLHHGYPGTFSPGGSHRAPRWLEQCTAAYRSQVPCSYISFGRGVLYAIVPRLLSPGGSHRASALAGAVRHDISESCSKFILFPLHLNTWADAAYPRCAKYRRMPPGQFTLLFSRSEERHHQLRLVRRRVSPCTAGWCSVSRLAVFLFIDVAGLLAR